MSKRWDGKGGKFQLEIKMNKSKKADKDGEEEDQKSQASIVQSEDSKLS